VIHARVKRHHEKLRSTLECQYGLLDELYTRCVLTDEQFEMIIGLQAAAGAIMYQQNGELLRLIGHMDMSTLNDLFSALEETSQSHIVTYIINNGRKCYRLSLLFSVYFITNCYKSIGTVPIVQFFIPPSS